MFRHMKSYLTCKFVSLSHLSCRGRRVSWRRCVHSSPRAAGCAFPLARARAHLLDRPANFSVLQNKLTWLARRGLASAHLCSRPLLPPRLIGRGSASQCPVVWRRRRPLAVEPSQLETGARLFLTLDKHRRKCQPIRSYRQRRSMLPIPRSTVLILPC